MPIAGTDHRINPRIQRTPGGVLIRGVVAMELFPRARRRIVLRDHADLWLPQTPLAHDPPRLVLRAVHEHPDLIPRVRRHDVAHQVATVTNHDAVEIRRHAIGAILDRRDTAGPDRPEHARRDAVMDPGLHNPGDASIQTQPREQIELRKERAPPRIRNTRRGDREVWEVYINGGRKPTGLEAVPWAREVERLGAGEIVLTSMDTDGTKDGYDLEITAAVSGAVQIPVVASGGAGRPEHLADAIAIGKADAALAASIFHFGELRINDVKRYMAERGVAVRPTYFQPELT